MVWKLAESSGPRGSLSQNLTKQCASEHKTSDETELVSLLESRAIEYAFTYRSTAESHHLKITTLSPEVNLSQASLAEQYAAATVDVRMTSNATTRVIGKPIAYALTIPTNAPHPAGARAFVAFLLSKPGQVAFKRFGFRPLSPAACRHCDALPSELSRLIGATQ